MEMGAGKLIILILVLQVSLLGAETWSTGLIPMDSSSVVTQEGELLADQYASQIKNRLFSSDHRVLHADNRAYASERFLRRSLIAAARSHHQHVSRQNEIFLSGRLVERNILQVPDEGYEPPREMPLSVKEIPPTISFSDDLAAYLACLEFQLDEIIGSSFFPEGDGYRLHIFQYYRGEEEMETLLFEFIVPGELLDPLVLEGSLGVFVSSRDTSRPLISLPPAADEPPLRTIPSGVNISGSSVLYGITKPGYAPQYLFSPPRDQVTEVLLTPAWAVEIYSSSMRSDNFYRSLAGLMLSVPAAFLAYDAAGNSLPGQLFFQAAVGMNITLAIRTLIDLFRYTNYLQ